MKNLEGLLSNDASISSSFPKWIHVDQRAIPSIITSLRTWSAAKNKFDTKGMLNAHQPANPKVADIVGAGAGLRFPGAEQDTYAAIPEQFRDIMVDDDDDDDDMGDMSVEKKLYCEHIKVFVPPAELWNRERGFDALEGFSRNPRKVGTLNYTQVMKISRRKKPSFIFWFYR